MGGPRLPTDDLELELEEVEGLVTGNGRNGHAATNDSSAPRSSGNGVAAGVSALDNLVKIKFGGLGGSKAPSQQRSRSGIGTTPGGGSGSNDSLAVRCVDRCQKSRSALFFLVAGLVVLLLVYNGEGEVQELEREGHPSLADVEGKEAAASSVAAAAPPGVAPGVVPVPAPEPLTGKNVNVPVSMDMGKVSVNLGKNAQLVPAAVPKEEPAKDPPPVNAPQPAKNVEISTTTGGGKVTLNLNDKAAPKEDPAPEPAKEEKKAEPAKEETKEEPAKEEDGKKGDAPASATEPAKEEDEKKKEEAAKPAPAPAPAPEKGPKVEPEPPKPWTAPKIDPDRKKTLVDKWGEWHFWDGDADDRPKEDYAGEYPHRDIKEENFPDGCWQVDAVYVNHFLDAASNLVQRAQEAIYAEYGHGKPEDGSQMGGEAMVERAKMFKIFEAKLGTAAMPPDGYENGGGWSTHRSLEGLKRRMMHAMMTNDNFTIVAGGSNVAAGGGNHFSQSYPMIMHAALEPVFARLGVNLITRNVGQEGVGTLHNALGSGSIYGDEVDLFLWDSEETEESKSQLDLIARQALLGGNRIPVLWGGNFDVLKDLHEKADVDVGQHGWGWNGVPVTSDEAQAKSLPWAAQFLKCGDDPKAKALCDKPEIKFSTKCWIERDDVKPPTAQDAHLDGQDANHPGYKWHHLLGRVLAFTVLDVLQDAVSTWSDVTITAGHPLPDEYWHMTDYYTAMRDKIVKLESGSCGEMKKFVPERLCKAPVRARTEYTPRANPATTSISSMVKPAGGKDGAYVPAVEVGMLYGGPDAANPAAAVPESAVDVTEIVGLGMDQDEKADGRRRRSRALEVSPQMAASGNVDANADDGLASLGQWATAAAAEAARSWASSSSRWSDRSLADAIVPGTGWEIVDELPGRCDGTASGQCGRLPSSKCLLSGHVDSRGGILGNALSGWLVLEIKDVREGVVVLKVDTDRKAEESTRTVGWTEVNNVEGGRRRLGGAADEHTPEERRAEAVTASSPSRRSLLPDSFEFDFAIDGTIQTLKKKEFEEKIAKPQDNIELLTVLDDPSMKKDLEVAIRLRGCGRECAIALTHVYWA